MTFRTTIGILCILVQSNSNAQSPEDNFRSLGASVGWIQACTNDKSLAKKLDFMFQKRADLIEMKPFVYEAYKKGLNEKSGYHTERKEYIYADCEKLKSDGGKKIQKELHRVIDKMTNE